MPVGRVSKVSRENFNFLTQLHTRRDEGRGLDVSYMGVAVSLQCPEIVAYLPCNIQKEGGKITGRRGENARL